MRHNLCKETVWILFVFLLPSVFAVTTQPLDVNMSILNVAPNITSYSPSSLTLSGNHYIFNATFVDFNNDSVRYHFAEVLNDGFNFTGNLTGGGLLSYDFAYGLGTYKVILFITDGQYNKSMEWNIHVVNNGSIPNAGSGGVKKNLTVSPVPVQPEVFSILNLPEGGTLGERLNSLGALLSPAYPAMGVLLLIILFAVLISKAWNYREARSATEQRRLLLAEKRDKKRRAAIE